MSSNSSTALPPLEHIGIVVEDIERTTEFLSSMWNLGPWDIIQESAPKREEITVGEPFKLKIAHAWLGSVLLELLQPLEGRTVWSEFLKNSGEGLHHIAFNVTNYDQMVSKLLAHGDTMVAGGIFNGEKWSYFNTEPGGIVVEFEELGVHAGIVDNLEKLGAHKSVGALSPLYHINAVVKDIDKTRKFLSSMWSIDPWKVFDFTLNESDMIVGETCKIKLAGARLEPAVLELIQPVEGNSVWSEFLEKKGEGLHHIAFSIPNWQKKVEELQEQGGKMLAGGVNVGMHWGYFYTTPGGIVIEFEEKIEGIDPVLSFHS